MGLIINMQSSGRFALELEKDIRAAFVADFDKGLLKHAC
tara:strand:- start:149 stop:265 length:117 start_codon:yes stop_codon:yes gene_type:complete